MTGEQARLAVDFALGLHKVKTAAKANIEVTLTPDECAGIIWGVKALREGMGVYRAVLDEPA